MRTLDLIMEEALDNLSASTRTITIYKDTYNRHLKKVLGSEDIEDITQKDLNLLFEKLSFNYASATLKLIKHTLRVAFDYAIEKYMLKTNVNTRRLRTAGKKTKRKEMIVPETEYLELVTCLKNTHTKNAQNYYLAVVIAHYTGMRSGEIFALEKQDIDLQHNKIYVNKKVAASVVDGNLIKYTEQPKTESSVREIFIHPKLKEVLEAKIEKTFGDILLYDADGGYIRPHKISTYLWHFSKRGNVKITMHMLRHTFATELLQNGVGADIVSNMMGHSNVQTTLNTYTHRKESELIEAISLIK